MVLFHFVISTDSTDSFEEAVEFKARQRRMGTPPLYNPARAEERPLPNILPPVQANAAELIEQARIIPCVVVIEQNPNIVAAQTGDENQHDNGINGENDALFEPLIENEIENQEFEPDPLALIKEEPLEPVHDDDIDEIANDIICADDYISESDSDGVNQAVFRNNVQKDEIREENNAQDENSNVREEVVFEKFNEDVSISVGEIPLPIFVGLQLKTNDDFSGKMRFVEFVSLFAF